MVSGDISYSDGLAIMSDRLIGFSGNQLCVELKTSVFLKSIAKLRVPLATNLLTLFSNNLDGVANIVLLNFTQKTSRNQPEETFVYNHITSLKHMICEFAAE